MIRPKGTISFLLVICISLLLAACGSSSGPARPKSVPIKAQWLGGSEGGVWIDCAQVDTNALDCKVFDSGRGTLLQRGKYVGRRPIMQADLVAFDGRTLLTRDEALLRQAE